MRLYKRQFTCIVLSVPTLIFSKMINKVYSGTIDERAINTGRLDDVLVQENLTLAINSAQALGCTVVNISTQDLMAEKEHLILGLLWQIIRVRINTVFIKHKIKTSSRHLRNFRL